MASVSSNHRFFFQLAKWIELQKITQKSRMPPEKPSSDFVEEDSKNNWDILG